MDVLELRDLTEVLRDWQGDLRFLRQNQLMSESQFLTFSQDRGIQVFGVVSGDPSEFVKRGWLASDNEVEDGDLLFHPFRIYPLHRILTGCSLSVAASSAALSGREQFLSFIEQILELRPNIEHIQEISQKCNRIVDLAILLEPIYWPAITGWQSGTVELSESDLRGMREQYKVKALRLVRDLSTDVWRQMHELLRFDAAQLDNNSELYVLLRLANWERRKQLKAGIAGALWIRHIAEVIRRAFEEAHHEEWPEEDEAFGWWPPEGRKRILGSSRPLDTNQSNRYVAWLWGLFTGSVVRWYVEGETEYYAIRRVLGDPARAGIELVNLKGMIKTEKRNVALTLQELLVEDKALRRFSMISFDMDAPQNVRVIRQQVNQKNVIGSIAAHEPDFEFHNFTIEELIEVAARLDESKGFCGDALRAAQWDRVSSGADLEKKYGEVSKRGRKLKGRDWGEALATFALEKPHRSDNGKERSFWGEIRAALGAKGANYDYQKDHYGLDSETFALLRYQAP